MNSFRVIMTGQYDCRIPISHNVVDYINNKINEKLNYYNLIKNKWNVCLYIKFLRNMEEYKVELFRSTTYKRAEIKTFHLLASPNWFITDTQPVKTLIEFIIQGIEEVFKNQYKRPPLTMLKDFKESIDYDYLLSIPYPAPFKEQMYAGDEQFHHLY